MGGLAIGVPGVAAKPHNDDGWTHVTGREVNQLLEEPEVRTLLDELGNPPLQRGRGEKTTVDVGASQLTQIAVPSHVGTLLSSKSDNGINEAFFAFGTPTKKNGHGRVPPGFLKRLPPKYRDLPAAGRGILRVGPNGEPALFGAGRETGVQTVSANDVSTADINVPDVVERYNTFDKMLNDCGIEDVDSLEGYVHQYVGTSFELSEPADVAGKFSLSSVVSSLVALTVAGLPIGDSDIPVIVDTFVSGLAVTELLSLTTGRNYTVGIHDNDLDYYFGKAPLITAGVANHYGADVSDLVYAGNYPTHLQPDYLRNHRLPVV